MQILHQNVKGVRDTLASFLELNIYAVRKDIQEKKIAMEEVVPYQVVKTESYQYITPSSSSQPQQQQIIYSTPSPSIETAASTEQLRYVKSEPMSVSSSNSQQEQVSTPSPMIPVSSSSMSYQIAKMEAGSSRSSPILRTSSPHFQMLNKSHGSVGANEQQHHQRASPLTITRDLSMQQQQPKTSPLAATTAPNMEMQTSSFYEQQPQEPMETSQLLPPSQETFITPADTQPLQFEPQQSQQPQISPPPVPQDAIDNGTPLTELPHDIALQRSLIDPATFSALMQRKVPGITIESPAFLMISEFLETKIRKLISDARLAAEHRSQQFRSNPNYV
uniref:Uncharacterized protein n=1 Tax=Panagrolaimus sp. ES5 TaxID=591445 RepID=A0AC34GDG4_9BILA